MYVCMHACMQVGRLVCMFVCMHACMSVSMYVCMDVWLSVCLAVCMSLCLAECLSVCLSNYQVPPGIVIIRWQDLAIYLAASFSVL